MRLPLRWRIAFGFTAVTAVVFLLLGLYLDSALLKNTTENERQRLLASAHLAAKALPDPPWGSDVDLQGMVGDLDSRSGARVTIIGPEGWVLADSRGDPSAMENHAERPERLQALSQGWGSAVRHSKTLGVDMLYVAVPLFDGAPAPAVLRLAFPLTAARAASAELRRNLAIAFVVAVSLVWLVSVWLASSLAAPVQRLVRVAQRVARGDLAARVEMGTGGELGELGGVFNATLERLSSLIATLERQAKSTGTMLQQMTDGVVAVDTQRRVQFANETFARAFGIGAVEIEGQNLEQLTTNYQLSLLLGRALSEGVAQRAEVRLLSPAARVLDGIATPLIDTDGRVMGAVALFRDLTALRQVERVRRDFVANVSHELRTPAAGIRALAEALQAGALREPDKAARFLEQIVEAAHRLTRILEDMLTLTRVEHGQESMNPRWLPVSGEFEAATAGLQPAAETKAIQLRAEVAEGDLVYADRAGLQTVLVNLLDNAVKYTPEGGTVSVTGRSVAGGYEISVADSGPGIAGEHLPRIFERFYRVDTARDRVSGGSGLGLAIVKHVVEAHGGRVTVQSASGQGSLFSVFFPSPGTTE